MLAQGGASIIVMPPLLWVLVVVVVGIMTIAHLLGVAGHDALVGRREGAHGADGPPTGRHRCSRPRAASGAE